MTNQPDNLSSGPDEQAFPRALRDALSRPMPQVPPVLDQSILHMAHDHFAQRRRRRLVRYSLFAATAAAAASLLLVFSLNHLGPSANHAPVPVAINTSHPTILDAFAMARELRDHPQQVQQTAAYHITRRPTVDQRDIDALAAAAVALPPDPAKPEALQ